MEKSKKHPRPETVMGSSAGGEGAGTGRKGLPGEIAGHRSDAQIVGIAVFVRLAVVETVAFLPAKRGAHGGEHHRAETRGYDGGEDVGGGHAAASVATASGNGLPIDCATSRKCAMREGGMPMVRQLWTVETGASISFATAEVPPR